MSRDSTRGATLAPAEPLCRSGGSSAEAQPGNQIQGLGHEGLGGRRLRRPPASLADHGLIADRPRRLPSRSDERRVGKAGVSQFGYGWVAADLKKKTRTNH